MQEDIEKDLLQRTLLALNLVVAQKVLGDDLEKYLTATKNLAVETLLLECKLSGILDESDLSELEQEIRTIGAKLVVDLLAD